MTFIFRVQIGPGEKSTWKMCKIAQELEDAVKIGGSWETGAVGRRVGTKKRTTSADRMELSEARNSKFKILWG
jgi:hypothetical protein